MISQDYATRETFKLSDANVETLREVNELPDEAVRPLLFLTLVLLFSQADTEAESLESSAPPVGRVVPRAQLLPGRWLRRRVSPLL